MKEEGETQRKLEIYKVPGLVNHLRNPRFVPAPDEPREDTAGRWVLCLEGLSIPKASEG